MKLKKKEVILMSKCNRKCEVYSRVVGYYRPVQFWNDGKQQEYKERKTFSEEVCLRSSEGVENNQLLKFCENEKVMVE